MTMRIPATSQWVSSGRRFPMAIMLVLAGGESRSEAPGSTLHSVKEASGKAAGRLAIRILPRVSGILYVLAPGRTEWRGGILIHSREK